MIYHNDVTRVWGKMCRFSVWRYGITLDWGYRRIIIGFKGKEEEQR